MQRITCYDCKAEINPPTAQALHGVSDSCRLSIEGIRHSISFQTEISAGMYETSNQSRPIVQGNEPR